MRLVARIAARFLRASGWVDVSPHRGNYIDAVWDMYEATYKGIGLHLPNAQALLKYDYWEVHVGSHGLPDAFQLGERTPFGLKMTLGGSDGTGPGKTAFKGQMRTLATAPGRYAEVSHVIESLAVLMGAPTVCVDYVEEILKKPVTPDPDGVHYTRNLGGLGAVKKRMVGQPKGIPTTDSKAPACGTNVRARVASKDNFEMAEHVACQIDLDE